MKKNSYIVKFTFQMHYIYVAAILRYNSYKYTLFELVSW